MIKLVMLEFHHLRLGVIENSKRLFMLLRSHFPLPIHVPRKTRIITASSLLERAKDVDVADMRIDHLLGIPFFVPFSFKHTRGTTRQTAHGICICFKTKHIYREAFSRLVKKQNKHSGRLYRSLLKILFVGFVELPRKGVRNLLVIDFHIFSPTAQTNKDPSNNRELFQRYLWY